MIHEITFVVNDVIKRKFVKIKNIKFKSTKTKFESIKSKSFLKIEENFNETSKILKLEFNAIFTYEINYNFETIKNNIIRQNVKNLFIIINSCIIVFLNYETIDSNQFRSKYLNFHL